MKNRMTREEALKRWKTSKETKKNGGRNEEYAVQRLQSPYRKRAFDL